MFSTVFHLFPNFFFFCNWTDICDLSLNLSQTLWRTTIGRKAGTTWAEPARLRFGLFPWTLCSKFIIIATTLNFTCHFPNSFSHSALGIWSANRPHPDPTLRSEMCRAPNSVKPKITDFGVHAKHLLFLGEQWCRIQQFVLLIINFPRLTHAYCGFKRIRNSPDDVAEMFNIPSRFHKTD